MANINRRNFLRISATAGAGAILVPGTAIGAVRQDDKKIKFPTRILGKTGIELPIISQGVMRADNPNVLRAAYNSGIIHFDTAHGYQNGKNEELVGNVFKGKPRESVVIATKGKFKYPLSDNFEAEYEDLLNTSLRRLQMDYVDIFYAHALGSVEEVTDERAIAMLKKFKAEGKTRFIGFSTHANKPAQIRAAIDSGAYDVILLSYNFSLGILPELNELIEEGAKAGIGFVAMKTMTGGVEDADGKKKINAQACLKWAWQNEHITTIIPGFSNFEELDECLEAARHPELNAEEKNYIAGLCNENLLYCQNCGKCLEQCPEHLPIPDIMRAYMYTYGYKFSSLSKETLAELDLPATTCASCNGHCRVNCTSHFDIAQKISKITPVLNVSNDFLT